MLCFLDKAVAAAVSAELTHFLPFIAGKRTSVEIGTPFQVKHDVHVSFNIETGYIVGNKQWTSHSLLCTCCRCSAIVFATDFTHALRITLVSSLAESCGEECNNLYSFAQP